jgi:mannose-6-phosphate isomerase-like protein (cupin superfamily)
MRRNLGRIGVGGLAAAIVAAFASPTARSQAAPRGSVFLSAADITRVITAPNGGGIDRQLRVVPSDTHNVGVGILRRGALKDSGAAAALNHERVSEVYYVISGSGTLLTGGTVKDVKPVDAKSETVTVLVGPSNNATFVQAAERRTLNPGDVVIIPQGVYHGFSDIPDHIEYLSMRADVDRVLPTGYVHPVLK